MFYKLKKVIPKEILTSIYFLFFLFFISMFFETMSLVSLIPFFKILSNDININEVVNSYNPISINFNFDYNQWIVIYNFYS